MCETAAFLMLRQMDTTQRECFFPSHLSPLLTISNSSFYGNLASIFAYPNGTVGETRILGNMDKGGVTDPLQYPVLFGKYQAHFPEFFYDGAISPNWTSILTKAGLPA